VKTEFEIEMDYRPDRWRIRYTQRDERGNLIGCGILFPRYDSEEQARAALAEGRIL